MKRWYLIASCPPISPEPHISSMQYSNPPCWIFHKSSWWKSTEGWQINQKKSRLKKECKSVKQWCRGLCVSKYLLLHYKLHRRSFPQLTCTPSAHPPPAHMLTKFLWWGSSVKELSRHSWRHTHTHTRWGGQLMLPCSMRQSSPVVFIVLQLQCPQSSRLIAHRCLNHPFEAARGYLLHYIIHPRVRCRAAWCKYSCG